VKGVSKRKTPAAFQPPGSKIGAGNGIRKLPQETVNPK